MIPATQQNQPDMRTELLALRATIDRMLERLDAPVAKAPEPSQRFMAIPRYAERCGWHVASVWCEGDRWQRIVWDSDYTAEHGETVGTLEDAQREAIEHARRLGVIRGEDEVSG